jgi:hypothetical protein
MQIHTSKGYIKKGMTLTQEQKFNASVKKDFRNGVLAFARGIGLFHKQKGKAYTAKAIDSSEFRYKMIACLYIDCFYPEGGNTNTNPKPNHNHKPTITQT